MRPRDSLDCRSGFTLVELLVVIGIIAVLISLLLPTLASARRSAQEVQCSSSLRQLGTGIVLYANQNRGFLPFGHWTQAPPVVPTFSSVSWDDLISPLLGRKLTDEQVNADNGPDWNYLRCPSDDVPSTNPPEWGFSKRSYSANGWIMPGCYNWPGTFVQTLPDGSPMIFPRQGKLSQLRSSSERILLTEWIHGANSIGAGGYTEIYSPQNMIEQSSYLPHGNPRDGRDLKRGRANFLFADGHVQALSPVDTIGNGTIAAPRGMWQKD